MPRSTDRERTRSRGRSRSSTPKPRRSSKPTSSGSRACDGTSTSTVEQARERGYVETIFKRRRYIPELKDRNFNIRAFGERTAQNSPIQGSAADLIKVAMIRIHHALIAKKMASRMLLQVHDELVFECPPDELPDLQTLAVHEMTTAVKLDVPLVVDVGTGANWLETKL